MSKSAAVILIAAIAATGSAANAVGSGDGYALTPDGPLVRIKNDATERLMSREAVLKQLAWRGYKDFARPKLIGRNYRIAATDRRGERTAITVDAYSGVVVHRGSSYMLNGVELFPPSGGR